MRLTVHMFQTLDGVVQGPGAPDEDRSGGFEHGGWLVPFGDEVFGEVVSGWFTRAGALLYGRVTFEMMRAYWPQVTDPDDVVARAINGLPRYVVSSTLTDPAWPGTTVLPGDPVEAVRALKEQPGDELQVHGSAALVQALLGAGLVDELRVLTFPVVLGRGKRLVEPGAPASGLSLVASRVTSTGVVYAEYTPAPLQVGGFTVEDGREVATTG